MQPKVNKMGVMPINRLIINMSLPIIASMLVQALYNIVDSIFVAQINEQALNAVSMAFPLQNLMIAVATGTGVGLNALISKSLGEKDNKLASKYAENGIFLAICSYILFLIIGLTCVRPFYEAQTDNAAIIEYGVEYSTIVLVASIGVFVQIAFERLMQSTGKTVFHMATQGTGAIINIILDPILIFTFDMGVAGAAWATVIGQAVAGLMGLILNNKYNKELKIDMKRFKPDFTAIKRIYIIGVPSIIMASIGSIMYFGVNTILIKMNETASAVFGVYFKLQSFIFMPVFGLNNGLIPIIGFNYGAQNRKRIMKTLKLGILYAVGIMFIGLCVFQFLPTQLLLCFNASAEMLRIGVPALRIISICFMFAGVCIVIGSLFQAFGKSLRSMFVSITRQLVILLPSAFLLSLTGEVNLVWFAFPIAEIGSCILSFIFFKNLYSKYIKKIPAGEE